MADPSNVIMGSGTAYIAPYGTSAPDITALPIDWSTLEPLGYTEDGIEFVYTPTETDIEVDEELAPIDSRRTKEELVINLTLDETTLNNLAKIIAGSTLTVPDGDGNSTLTIGSKSTTDDVKYIFGFEGPAPPQGSGTTGTRAILVWKVKSTAAVSFKYTRKSKVMYKVAFRAYADSTHSAGERLFKAVDFNAAGS